MSIFRDLRGRGLVCLLLALFAGSAYAFQPFVIKHIRVEGLQRIEKGTVFNYMDVGVGDTLDQSKAQGVIRSLYNTGFFSDVELERQGDTLIVKVKERPTISSFSISGNKSIKTDKLKKALTKVGLAQGRVFNRSLLDQVEQELRRQYYSNGKYGVKIHTDIKHEVDNRVSLAIKIHEGQVATIRKINIVGNHVFSDSTLKDQMKLTTPGLFTWYTKNDRYSRQALSGDLQSIQSYYQDRGYVNMRVESTQVSLSPDKKSIYITINIHEGSRYKVGNVNLAGDLILPRKQLRKFIDIRPGAVFSRQKATQAGKQISQRLGEEGYAFANVNPIPEIDQKNKTVKLTFYVEPGNRFYVRHVNFSGNEKTDDYVLRREMRQFESGIFNGSAVKRGRTRLTRLPFVESAKVNTKRVPGSDDKVDVNYDVKERSAGSFQVGVGYSGSQGALLNASVSHSDFLGTGDRVSLRADRSHYTDLYSFSLTQPYYTLNGISRTISAFYRRTSALTQVSSSFTTKTYGGTVSFGIPISEYDNVNLGLGYQYTDVFTSPVSPLQVEQFVHDNGNRLDSVQLQMGVSRDTRDRTIFPDRGYLHSLSTTVAVPPGDLRYVLAQYRYQQMLPINKYLLGESDNTLAWGHAYGRTTDVPPWQKYFGGGMGTVRGFQPSYLGPRDQFNNPVGGDVLVSSQNSLFFPRLFKSHNMRFGVFFDAGNVYARARDFKFRRLRTSVGLTFQWLTPVVGLMQFSLAHPINTSPNDQTQVFGFTFGSSF
ncbi:MAG TPA: outer membrane protein assembly factor BamA [Gammaproteobacteria bacterium]|nr:outer membrane protein assembly factor BamA [Gammaproteobacteria bacterium]